MKRPANCLGCERRFRPHHAPAENHPGSVQHHGRGLCLTCKSRERRGIEMGPLPVPKPKLFECPCGQLTRPRRMPVAEALALDPRPTITRIGSVCYRCSDGRPKVTPERIDYITRELEAYMRWRGRDISQLGLAS